jgi:hypothetical protein
MEQDFQELTQYCTTAKMLLIQRTDEGDEGESTKEAQP